MKRRDKKEQEIKSLKSRITENDVLKQLYRDAYEKKVTEYIKWLDENKLEALQKDLLNE